MRQRLSSSVKTLLERYVPAGTKQRGRSLLASYFADRAITYRELSNREGVQTWTFGTPPSFEFTDPVYYNELPDEIARLVGRHECHQPRILRVPDVEIRGRQGFKRTHDGKYIVFNFWQPPNGDSASNPAMALAYDIVDALGEMTWPLSTPKNSADGLELDHAVPLIHRWARNYSHWTEEWLTQLEGVAHYAEVTGEQPTLLIPSDPPDFIPESLSVLGYSPDEYVEMTDRVQVDRLVLPSIRRCWSSTSDDYIRDISGLEWVREQVLANVSLSTDRTTPSKLLISRQEDAETRRIVNWDEVESFLSRRGYETVILTELDFREQKRLFSGADVIVGPHGAGMTELMYASDAAVLELFREDYIVPVYYEMATGLGHEYGCLVCDSKRGDLVVETEELHSAVKAVEEAAGVTNRSDHPGPEQNK